MTVDEMIEQLEMIRDDMGGETEVRVAYQPNYPLRGTVATVMGPAGEDLYEEGETARGQDNDANMAWIAVDNDLPYDENPYAPKWAWNRSF